MKKRKNILNIVFGTMLSLSIIAACSVADDKDSDTPKGMNSEFVQYVKGQESVVEADKEVYAVFNESGGSYCNQYRGSIHRYRQFI